MEKVIDTHFVCIKRCASAIGKYILYCIKNEKKRKENTYMEVQD